MSIAIAWAVYARLVVRKNLILVSGVASFRNYGMITAC